MTIGEYEEVEREGVKMMLFRPEGDDSTIYCRAEVGSLEGLDDEALTCELTEANFFWQDTNGATFSEKDGKVFLTDRRDEETFSDDDGAEEYLSDFADTVNVWRERLEAHRLNEGEEA